MSCVLCTVCSHCNMNSFGKFNLISIIKCVPLEIDRWNRCHSRITLLLPTLSLSLSLGNIKLWSSPLRVLTFVVIHLKNMIDVYHSPKTIQMMRCDALMLTWTQLNCIAWIGRVDSILSKFDRTCFYVKRIYGRYHVEYIVAIVKWYFIVSRQLVLFNEWVNK